MAGFSSRKPLWAHGIEYDNLMPISFLSDLTLSAAIPVEVSNNFTKTTITDDTRNITQHIILPNVDSLFKPDWCNKKMNASFLRNCSK